MTTRSTNISSSPGPPGLSSSLGGRCEEDGGRTLLSPDNEVCLAWLEGVLGRLRAEGQTKVAGYLVAVLEEVVLEVELRKEELEIRRPDNARRRSALWELPGQSPQERED